MGISLVEMALGQHPYFGLNYCEQILNISKNDPPKLKSPRFTVDFCDLIDHWYFYLLIAYFFLEIKIK